LALPAQKQAAQEIPAPDGGLYSGKGLGVKANGPEKPPNMRDLAGKRREWRVANSE
jgi:hypothetical protein